MTERFTEHEKVFLKSLSEDPVWSSICKKVSASAGDLPAFSYNPATGQDNRVEWMQASMFRDGFLSCLQMLGVKHD